MIISIFYSSVEQRNKCRIKSSIESFLFLHIAVKHVNSATTWVFFYSSFIKRTKTTQWIPINTVHLQKDAHFVEITKLICGKYCKSSRSNYQAVFCWESEILIMWPQRDNNIGIVIPSRFEQRNSCWTFEIMSLKINGMFYLNKFGKSCACNHIRCSSP